ncbi:MAG TPA: IMP cyclohydrolase [Nitrospirae bacterium]|nr:IMP cyclohydrolase [Nitrospirota bacterium]
MIKRAIISLSDKSGIKEFAQELVFFGIEIFSTGGTAKTLRELGIKVTDVSEYTGFPEIMDGRVKTLHPKIHGGLLARRKNPQDMKILSELGIVTIDMVVVNLYPFEATISKKDVSFEEAIENIDIGGPTMLRSSAKNFEDVVVIIDPNDYKVVTESMKKNNGDVERTLRIRLAQKVFETTSRYDSAISNFLKSKITNT